MRHSSHARLSEKCDSTVGDDSVVAFPLKFLSCPRDCLKASMCLVKLSVLIVD
jgi:hypothetical protein